MNSFHSKMSGKGRDEGISRGDSFGPPDGFAWGLKALPRNDINYHAFKLISLEIRGLARSRHLVLAYLYEIGGHLNQVNGRNNNKAQKDSVEKERLVILF